MAELVAAVTPDSVSWKFLTAQVLNLATDETVTIESASDETALVVVSGKVRVRLDDISATITRDNVFVELADLAYAPPGLKMELTATKPTQIAIGQAPASGLYPPRIIAAAEMEGVVRGGGPARRQVVSPLAGRLPAESLLVYEGWVPRGSWTGWPPHRHDGFADSPTLEETYFYRFDRASGFGFHRNYAPEDQWEDFHLLRDQALVPVPRGYHLCGNGPAANMWLLNFLAGPSSERDRQPFLDPSETWIQDDWSAGAMKLPIIQIPSVTT